MLLGYARVSTQDQSLNLQRDALKKAGCKKIFSDVASGSRSERPGFTKATTFARRGDTIVVWRLDRFGRSLGHLIETVRELQARKVGFRSLQESIDTTTSSGKLIFHVFGALAEFERDIIRERTNAGLSAARARGRMGGRPRVLEGKNLAHAHSLFKDKNNTPREIARTLGVSIATLYRYVSATPATSAKAKKAAPKVEKKAAVKARAVTKKSRRAA